MAQDKNVNLISKRLWLYYGGTATFSNSYGSKVWVILEKTADNSSFCYCYKKPVVIWLFAPIYLHFIFDIH